MPGPIDPNAVDNIKDVDLPEEVFEAFNILIKKHWNGNSANVIQDDVIYLLVQSMDITRAEVFKRGLLNVEHAYTKAGWKVEYDKPGYNESYEAHFIFRK